MSETELTGPDILEDIKSGRLVVAPREATPEMRAAAYPMIEHEETSRALITWEAMLAASPDHTTALLSLVEGMEAQARESAMQSLADGYQAEEAYAAQKAAEARALAAAQARIRELEEAIWLAHDQLNTYRSAAVEEVIDKLETYIPGLSGKEAPDV